jgi:uncharacterized repeat protein (TIGR03803 family)
MENHYVLCSLRFLVLAAVCGVSSAQTAKETTLHTFAGTDGFGQGFIIQAADSNYYGISAYGGGTTSCLHSGGLDGSCGVIYRLTPTGAFTILHTFSGIADGGVPTNIIQGSDGNLYGTTAYGGSGQCLVIYGNGISDEAIVGCGTIFRITASGVFTSLYSFTGGSDGNSPNMLIEGSDGNFYGTTILGGTGGYGTVFRFASSASLTSLFAFLGDSNGGAPNALVQGSDGLFYGTTQAGGQLSGGCKSMYLNGCGTIFSVSSSGTLKTIYTFSGSSDGAEFRNARGRIVVRQPGRGFQMGGYSYQLASTALTEGNDGRFYGITPEVVTASTIYSVDSVGNLKTLYTFGQSGDGGGSGLGLFLASDGNFYSSSGNVIFSTNTSGTFTPIYTFTGQADGGNPDQFFGGVGGIFVGPTESGGSGSGTIASLSVSPSLAAPVQLTFSPSTVTQGFSTTLTWKVANAFSTTMKQCYAFENTIIGGSITGSTWNGLQTGSIANGVYTGSAVIMASQAGDYNFALTCGGIESGFATLVVAPPLTILTSSLPGATVGGPYTVTVSATGAVPPYNWSIAPGSSLPPGLSLGASSGAITGFPTQSGTFNFVIKVADSESSPATSTLTTSIVVAPAPAPSVSANPATLTVSAPGGSASTSLTFSNFISSSFSVTCSGLPSGAACNLLNATGTTGTLQITTIAPTSAILREHPGLTPYYAIFLLGPFYLFARVKFAARLSNLIGVILAVSFVTLCAGCGSGGKQSVASIPGTPVGTYALMVNVVAGTQSAPPIPISLVVQ